MKHFYFKPFKHTNLNLAVGLFVVAGAALAAMPPVVVQAAPADEPKQKYIVVLKESSGKPRDVANEHVRSHKADVSRVYGSALKGYAAAIPEGRLEALRKDPRVDFVEPDGIAQASTIQSPATWGLDRLSQRYLPLNDKFGYINTGTGVKVYVIDSGIRASHGEFGGRVIDGVDTIDGALPADDCNGHGTHVAGTVGGSTYGVAKNVSLISVRVLDCNGSGSLSGVIAGIDYVTANHVSGKPAVANMSLGSGASSAVDTAVKNSISKGISYAVAAGNDSSDACYKSPARVAAAMTIGATDKTDTRPSWSNYGSCVDWFAPGADITSAWITDDAVTKTISGTSMATPHTAGVAALYLQGKPSASPSTVRSALYSLTTKDIVRSSKSYNDHLLFTNL
ncbi:MAG TPA: S8 family peptidase [Candidatus Saccharimonadales bacterium]|nr:S8 family peptidase [Candidatus Saccharimonadales bacterium]